MKRVSDLQRRFGDRAGALGHRLEEMRRLGPKKLAFRVGYEAWQRSGLSALAGSGSTLGAYPEPSTERWLESLPLNHWWRQICEDVTSGKAGESIKTILTEAGVRQLLIEAEAALEGRIKTFGSATLDYGAPVDWHLNPKTGALWPRVDSTQVLRHQGRCGDVKLSWEVNRFPHLYAWGRAYAVTQDPRWPRAFAEQLRHWEQRNPFGIGVNWSSGQELAIRALAWTWGLAVMGSDAAFGEEDFARAARLLSAHAAHIEKHIDYARLAVHNNHLIGEALGLFLVGSCFPRQEGAARWRSLGRRLMATDGLAQFTADGGYCQSSHTYHRLAVDYYLWAVRLGAFDDEELERVMATLTKSSLYFEQFMNLDDGRLPNWGANDGARLQIFSTCDYTDFRPVVSAINYLTQGVRTFKHGAFDEALRWRFGHEALEAPLRQPRQVSRSFPDSGLHVLRDDGGSFAVLRAGSVTDRFGQADQLHVDLWHRGENLALDGGSYCYNDELQFHRWFMGSRSHNTVTVDGHDQMLLFRRFKWLYWSVAQSAGVKGGRVEGSHDSYRWLGVGQHRQVSRTERGYRIVDTLDKDDRTARTLRLHWLLPPAEPDLARQPKGWRLKSRVGEVDFELRLWAECIEETAGDPDVLVSVESGVAGHEPKGWHSRYYSSREPALSVEAMLTAQRGIRFFSEFVFS